MSELSIIQETLKENRREQREDIAAVFSKMETLETRLSAKLDRIEKEGCGNAPDCLALGTRLATVESMAQSARGAIALVLGVASISGLITGWFSGLFHKGGTP